MTETCDSFSFLQERKKQVIVSSKRVLILYNFLQSIVDNTIIFVFDDGFLIVTAVTKSNTGIIGLGFKFFSVGLHFLKLGFVIFLHGIGITHCPNNDKM